MSLDVPELIRDMSVLVSVQKHVWLSVYSLLRENWVSETSQM